MNGKLRNDSVCRCCLSNIWSKDLHEEYFNNGRIEIYSNMLFETLKINIVKHERLKNLICEKCITKLRDATDFKAQILTAEKVFQQYLESSKGEEHIDKRLIKSENNNGLNDCDVKIRDENIIETDIDCCRDDESKEKGQVKILKLEDDIIKVLRNNNARNQGTKKCDSKNNSTIGNVRKKNINRVNKEKKAKAVPSARRKPSTASERQIAIKQNTMKLILNSNMLMFISHKTKFGCYVCKQRFLDIKNLREHVKTHPTEKNIILRVRQMRGMSCKKVDISNLTCKLCSSDRFSNISDLQHHLTSAHNIVFKGTEHFLIPYKLETGLQCAVCGQNFNSFLNLSIHMNSHSTNNVCEICGCSYVNRLSLRNHVHSMHSENKCTQCNMTFKSGAARKSHMIKIHNLGKLKRYYCRFCEKIFHYTYLLKEHNIKEHGAKPEGSCLCIDCGKSFPSANNLKVHMRAVHIKERNYSCDACEMCFFTKHDLKRHERKHEDVKLFSCSYCEVRFKTKDSLRRHLKRQHPQS